MPTPAAARYRPSGAPNPPVPTSSTLAAFSFCWPFHADFRDDQVPAVAQDLFLGKRRLGAGGAATVEPPAIEGTSEIVSPSSARGGVFAQVADVFVVQVHVDEAAQLAFVVEDLLAQVGNWRGERGRALRPRWRRRRSRSPAYR